MFWIRVGCLASAVSIATEASGMLVKDERMLLVDLQDALYHMIRLMAVASAAANDESWRRHVGSEFTRQLRRHSLGNARAVCASTSDIGGLKLYCIYTSLLR